VGAVGVIDAGGAKVGAVGASVDAYGIDAYRRLTCRRLTCRRPVGAYGAYRRNYGIAILYARGFPKGLAVESGRLEWSPVMEVDVCHPAALPQETLFSHFISGAKSLIFDRLH